jgi:hypothetical protein
MLDTLKKKVFAEGFSISIELCFKKYFPKVPSVNLRASVAPV